MRVRSRRLFQIGRWHLVGAFHETTESTAIDLIKVPLDEPVETTAVDLIKVLLDEPVETTAVDFVKVSFLTTERYATENNIQHAVDHVHTIELTKQPAGYGILFIKVGPIYNE